ncbi:hypothetical protein [Pseudobutyrivibrio xylanivorans]|uniref:Membrane protein 6-pyruvoyl-tetrahydropterin synthase-related domain-containing protein n=1 Tax=Pseudobutyrivibrio xylanivorans TaxID=185007 RepID=A0A1G5RXT3_PSEXY|nr:hypothetical protein [Pseudobutyrivibrio xylanivorans]SCZ78668.1 hypothetical protein SAMN02910350_01387 [Pseudobutyrivibrio xylanivorans]
MIKNQLNKFFNSKLFIALFLMALVVVASVPAFRSAIYEGHDLNFHIGRIQAIAEAIKSGQLPVRYEENAWYGHGYVSSLFYGNIFLYVPAMLYNMGLPVYRAYNIYLILVNVATAIIGYYSFKGILGDRYYAVMATILYTLAGYRLTDLYVRTSLGEFTAMAFLPLCIYGLYRVYKKDNTNILLNVLPLVLGVTGLIESHIISTELFILFALVFAIINFKDTLSVIRELLLAGVLIFLLNSFFIIPFIESYFTLNLNANSKSIIGNLGTAGLNLQQIFGPITYNSNIPSTHHSSYNVGFLVLFCEILTIIYLVKAIVCRKSVSENNNKERYLIQIACFGMLSTWMATMYFPWKVVSEIWGLKNIFSPIQFASRFLTVQTILLVISGVFVIKQHTSKNSMKIIQLFGVAFIALIMTGIFHYTLSFGVNLTYQDAPDYWADKLYLPVGTEAGSLTETEITIDGEEYLLPKLAYNNVKVFDANGSEITTHVSKNNCIGTSKDVDIDNITVKYVEPALWRISEIISVLTLVGVIVFGIRSKRIM